jgi:hypothetical protein
MSLQRSNGFTKSLILLLMVLPCRLFADTTFVSGTIVSATWNTSASPYCVTGDILIAGLTIEPGVKVIIRGNYVFEVAGKLTAIGTQQDSIIFERADAGVAWQGIYFNFSVNGSELAYCRISGSQNSGIRINSSYPKIRNSSIINNSSSNGGGFYVWASPLFRLEDCVISNNSVSGGNSIGGGIYVEGGETYLHGCIIRKNSSSAYSYYSRAYAYGGGIYVNGVVLAENCIIDSNSAGASSYFYDGYAYGGGIYSVKPLVLMNSIISFNSVGGSGVYGGGICHNSLDTLKIINSTIAYNSSHGIYRYSGNVEVVNSIIFFNSAQISDVTVATTYSDVQNGFPGQGNINVNPIFSSFSNLQIVPGSGCVDAGDTLESYNDICFAPSLGSNRNDMGAHGGPFACGWIQDTVLPATPVLLSPDSGITGQAKMLTLRWDFSASARQFHLQVSTNSSFSSFIVNDSTLMTSSKQVGPLQDSTRYYWRVKASNTMGSSDWSTVFSFKTFREGDSASLRYGLVAYYPFSGNPYDSSGAGHNGTISGGVALTGDRSGAPDSAYTFNRFDGVIVADSVNVNQIAGGINTLSFWMKWDGREKISDSGAIPFSFDTQYDLKIKPGNFGFSTGETNSIGFNPIGFVNKWVHVVAVFVNGVPNSTNCKLYINGVKRTLSGSVTRNVTATKKVRFGNWAYDTDSPFGGSLDDIRLYNRELSNIEIQSLYHEGDWGLLPHASASGLVFNDCNFNKVFDAGDSTIFGVKIVLKDTSGVVVDSTESDEVGKYEMNIFSAGTYSLSESIDSTWIQTQPPAPGTWSFTVALNDSLTGKNFVNVRSYKYIGPNNGNWSVDTNWQSHIVPGSKQSVVIPAKIVNIDALPHDTIGALRIDSGGILNFKSSIGKLKVLQAVQVDDSARLDFSQASDSTGLICYSDFVNLGTIDPGQSTVIISGDHPKVVTNGDPLSDQDGNAFYNLSILGDSTSVVGDIIIKNQLLLEKGIDTRPQDSVIVRNSDTNAIAGSGIITQGTIVRDIKSGETRTYRFESPSTYLRFTGEGTNPTSVAMLISSPPTSGYFYWDSTNCTIDVSKKTIVTDPVRIIQSRWPIGVPRPRVVQSIRGPIFQIDPINRMYSIYPDSGSDYKAVVSLRYTAGDLPGLSGTQQGLSSLSGSEDNLKIFQGPYYADSVVSGWNMLSLPLEPDSAIKDSLFPPPISDAFAYEGSYIRKPKLDFGKGYWMKFPEAQEVIIGGNDIDSFAIPVNQGWNMIGSISYPVAVTSIQSIPMDIIVSNFYEYGAGYESADTLKPMYGYWMKSSSAGKLVFSANASSMLPKGSSSGNSVQDMNTLMIADSRKKEGRLYFCIGKGINVTRYILPPVPPEGIYDVRFATGNMVATAGEQKDNEIPIRIQSAEYPVTLRWEMKDQAQSASLIVNGRVTRMNQSGSIVVTDPDADIRLKLTSEIIDELPKEYTLSQNYPNPFNPATTIRYTVPGESRVKLTVYNILGQVVIVLRDGVEDAGYRSINWNASSAASGIYFYQLEATSTVDPGKSFMQVMKMILLK